MTKTVPVNQLVGKHTEQIQAASRQTIFAKVLSVSSHLHTGETEGEEANPAVGKASEGSVTPIVRHNGKAN